MKRADRGAGEGALWPGTELALCPPHAGTSRSRGTSVELQIDGERIDPPGGFDRVGPLIDQVLIDRCTGHRVASRVWIDGAELDTASLETLTDRPTAGLARVEIETRAVDDVARSALESAGEYAPKIADRLSEAAAAYRGGEERAAGAALAESMDALVVLFEALRGVGAVLTNAAPLARLETEIAPALAELETLQAGGDWIGAADWIEYELADALRSWSAALREGGQGG